jgi:transposase, IS30 family
MAAGEFINDAAVAAGSYRKQGTRWLAAAAGVRPRRGRGLKGRCLTLAQREEIALGRAPGDSIRAIAGFLGRSPSTVSRELRRNADGLGRYRATTAHALAYHRASRPKPAKLLTNLRLRSMVEADLAKKYSPEQIAGRLKVDFPDQPEMQVSTETIYQSLYVQSRGALKRDLTRYLRTGRAVRRPSRKVGQRKNRIPNMINIAERPAEAEDRAVPGHWEGDLIIGRKNLSAIGTLVERTTNYTMLLHLPDGYTPELVRDALGGKDQDPARDAPGVADLGSGTGDAGLETSQRCRGHRHLLLRSARALAAGHQREHQRPAPPVLSEGNRPLHPQRPRPRLDRRRTQRPAPETLRLQETDRTDRTSSVALTARIRRSAYDAGLPAGVRSGR